MAVFQTRVPRRGFDRQSIAAIMPAEKVCSVSSSPRPAPESPRRTPRSGASGCRRPAVGAGSCPSGATPGPTRSPSTRRPRTDPPRCRGPRARGDDPYTGAVGAYERVRAKRINAVVPATSGHRIYLLPISEIRTSRSLPPGEVCRGTRPSQAANRRPPKSTPPTGAVIPCSDKPPAVPGARARDAPPRDGRPADGRPVSVGQRLVRSANRVVGPLLFRSPRRGRLRTNNASS